MSMGGGGGTTTTTKQELDPAVRPYVEYGLGEAKRLYETGAPQYYSGQTYVSPSSQTQTALQMAEQRAMAGSPLTQAAQQQTLANIQGQYLGGNPFFQGAFNPAAQAAQNAYFDATRQIGSQAASKGRYGSGAQQQLQDRAAGTFAQALTNTAGNLAYQNYDAERARQMAAVGAAPAMSEAGYADINKLMTIGQAQEGYQEMALQDAINRFNFQQNLPQAQLQQFLSAAYGSPQGGISTQPVYSNRLGSALGAGALGYGMTGSPYGAAAGAALGGLLG